MFRTMPGLDEEASSSRSSYFGEVLFMVALVATWYLASAYSVIVLKELLSPKAPAVAGVVDATFAQFALGMLLGASYDGWKPDDLEPTAEESRALMKASMFGLAGAAATNWAIVSEGASFSQIVKLLEPAVTVVVSFVVIGERTSRQRMVCIAITVVGVFLSSSRAAPTTSVVDSGLARAIYIVTFTTGIVVMMVGFALRNVYSKRMAVQGSRAYTAVSAMSLRLMTPFVLGRLACLGIPTEDVQPKFLANAALNATYNLLSFAVLARVSPVTHAQLRLGKRIVSLIVSMVTLKDVDLTWVEVRHRKQRPLYLRRVSAHQNIPQVAGLVMGFAGLVGFLFAPKVKLAPATAVLRPDAEQPLVGTSTVDANSATADSHRGYRKPTMLRRFLYRADHDLATQVVNYGILLILVVGTEFVKEHTVQAPA